MFESEDGMEPRVSQAMLDELNRLLEESFGARNAAADPAMGNLSPDQVTRLIYSEWGVPGGGVQFNPGVELADLEGAEFFREARIFLLALHDAGEVRATVAKNLPRQFVAEVLPRICSEEGLEKIYKYNKVVNEMDIAAIHYSRVVAQAAGLVRLYKGKFGVPKGKAAMLQEDRAGDLFCCLFAAFFRKFNLDYAYGFGFELRALQTCAAYTLYRLGEVAKDWRPVDQLPDEVLLPAARDEIEGLIHSHGFWTLDRVLASRLLHWFLRWGVLEGMFEQKGAYGNDLKAVRVTPLYRKLLRFELDG